MIQTTQTSVIEPATVGLSGNNHSENLYGAHSLVLEYGRQVGVSRVPAKNKPSIQCGCNPRTRTKPIFEVPQVCKRRGLLYDLGRGKSSSICSQAAFSCYMDMEGKQRLVQHDIWEGAVSNNSLLNIFRRIQGRQLEYSYT